MESDLTDEESMLNAIEGCKYVVHVASPVPGLNKVKDENEVIRPAVEGTMAVMKGAHKHGVKRVVITSSMSAIQTTKDKKKTHFTEEDWTDLSIANAYNKSKTLAERSAWEFVEKLPEHEKIDLVTLQPGLVLGPCLITQKSGSADFVARFLEGRLPGLPHITLCIVDVRDLAQAHLQACLVDEAAGHRFIMVAKHPWFKELSEWAYEAYGSQFPKLTRNQIPKMMLTIASIFHSGASNLKKQWGVQTTSDNSKSQRILGINYREPKESLIDMIASLIETGYVKPPAAKTK